MKKNKPKLYKKKRFANKENEDTFQYVRNCKSKYLKHRDLEKKR